MDGAQHGVASEEQRGNRLIVSRSSLAVPFTYYFISYVILFERQAPTVAPVSLANITIVLMGSKSNSKSSNKARKNKNLNPFYIDTNNVSDESHSYDGWDDYDDCEKDEEEEEMGLLLDAGRRQHHDPVQASKKPLMFRRRFFLVLGLASLLVLVLVSLGGESKQTTTSAQPVSNNPIVKNATTTDPEPPKTETAIAKAKATAIPTVPASSPLSPKAKPTTAIDTETNSDQTSTTRDASNDTDAIKINIPEETAELNSSPTTSPDKPEQMAQIKTEADDDAIQVEEEQMPTNATGASSITPKEIIELHGSPIESELDVKTNIDSHDDDEQVYKEKIPKNAADDSGGSTPTETTEPSNSPTSTVGPELAVKTKDEANDDDELLDEEEMPRNATDVNSTRSQN